MDTSKNKKYGTREDVYKCIATHTAGGLTKNDIIEKKNGQHTIYISKKLSDKMKASFNIIRTLNPNHLTRIKKTMVSINNNDIKTNNTNTNTTNTNTNTNIQWLPTIQSCAI